MNLMYKSIRVLSRTISDKIGSNAKTRSSWICPDDPTPSVPSVVIVVVELLDPAEVLVDSPNCEVLVPNEVDG